MPVRSLGHGCYRWGHGKKYCGPGARKKAEKQGRAAYSHGYRSKETKMKRATRKEGRVVVTSNDAEQAGAKYAKSQIDSAYFMDWVRDQLLEASKMPPSDVLPLEDKHDAKIIAKNMLQQLEWDTKKGLGDREIKDLIGTDVTPSAHDAFYVGFKKACDASRDLLADELLTIKGEMGGGGRVEAHRSAPDAGPTTLIIDGGLEARLLKTGGPSKTLQAKTETWVVHHAGEPGSSVLQVDIFKPNGKPWAAWTGNFTQASKREIANKVAAARNGTGVGEARTVNAKSRYGNPHPKYKPGKGWRNLEVTNVVTSNGAYLVEFSDGFTVQVHGGSGRDDILYAMRTTDTRLERREPGPERRRDYQYVALQAVLRHRMGNQPADFVVDHDGDVQARLTAVVREVGASRRPKGTPIIDRNFSGYDFTTGPDGTKIKRQYIDPNAPGDHGADPLGDGTFRMVPSGDIVDHAERNRRLARFNRESHRPKARGSQRRA